MPSVAGEVPPVSTSTVKVTSSWGSALTVTGTSTVPASSLTVSVWALSLRAAEPNATRAAARSGSVIVTLAQPASAILESLRHWRSVDAGDHPDAVVETTT